METETPGRKLARLNAEQERLTKEIQDHKTKWAERNFLAQRTREPVSTPEITAFKTHHRDLSCALADVSLQIGTINKEIRQHKAEVQTRKARSPEPELNGSSKATPKKECPHRQHPAWPQYFLLAAENELTRELYVQIERSAKGMLQQSLDTGIE
jgi:hypothetical protein